MSIDNSTGKTKGFYERGQAIFDRIPGMPEDDAPAPSRLYDLREWLMSQIDGSIETRGDDSLISHFINQIDALYSLRVTIPDAERKKVMDAHLAATVEPKGCPTPGSCSAVAELADLKQRLLPQYLGRAERAEMIVSGLRQQLDSALFDLQASESRLKTATGATDRPDWARQLPGAELYDRDHGYDRTASLNAGHYVCLCGGACSHYTTGGEVK